MKAARRSPPPHKAIALHFKGYCIRNGLTPAQGHAALAAAGTMTELEAIEWLATH
jgi:hypothetical protein